MWGEALQSYDQIGIVKMSALLKCVTDRMVMWRKITSKVKVEVKAAEVQEAHCGVT